MKGKAKTLDEYLVAPERRQASCAREAQKTIQPAAPEAEECISYQLPPGGKPLVAFGAATNHSAFYPVSSSTRKLTRTSSGGTRPARARSASHRPSSCRRPSCGSWSRRGSRRAPPGDDPRSFSLQDSRSRSNGRRHPADVLTHGDRRHDPRRTRPWPAHPQRTGAPVAAACFFAL